MQHKALIQDWMTANPATAQEDMSLMGAYYLMQQRDVRRLPVVENGRLIGIVTRSDIQQQIPWNQDQMFGLAGRVVGEIMTRDPLTVGPNQTLKDAAALMRTSHVSGLPVVENGQLVGIITESDIFRLVTSAWMDETEA